MKKVAALSFLALCLSLNGCAILTGKEKRNAGQIASDARITTSVNAQLLSKPKVKTMDINVDTYMGEVTLSGTVPSAEARQEAIKAASAVSGVQKVKVKNLRVVPSHQP